MLFRSVAAAIFARVTKELGMPDAELRASLVASQIIGLAIGRYIVGIEPLASAPREVLIAAIAPTIQRYLAGDLNR